MKKSKKMKLILIILICVLIALIGFGGIYVERYNSYKNLLREYELASYLKGSTVIEFEIDDSEENVYYDKDGKIVDSADVTDENKKDYIEKTEPVNEKENLTEDNYKKVVDIMKQRLNFLDTDQYNIDLDTKTGKIVLTFEDEYPEDIKNILPMEGKMQLVDSNTGDIVLDYTDFDSAEASYASLDEGYTTYVSLKLNSSGIEKINNIDKYKTADDTEKQTEEKETDETTEESKLKIQFDGEEIAEVSYDEVLLNGKTLRLTTATALSTDSEINSELNTNTIVCKLTTMGKMPVIYNLTAEEFVKSDFSINYIIIGLAIICAITVLYLIVKYKVKGLLSAIAFVSNIALFLIVIRLTKIPVSLNGFAGMLSLVVLNLILVNNILNSIKNDKKAFSENIKAAYLKSIDAFVIFLIIFAVFSFSSMSVINSMGLLLFWGWIIVLLGNLGITVPMLATINKK